MFRYLVLATLLSFSYCNNILAVNEQVKEIVFFNLTGNTERHTIQYVHQQNQEETQQGNNISNKYNIGIVEGNNTNNIENNIILPITTTETVIKEITRFLPTAINRLPVNFKLIHYILTSNFDSQLFGINNHREKLTFAFKFINEINRQTIYFQQDSINKHSVHDRLVIENENTAQIIPFLKLLRSLFVNFIEYPDSIKVILSQLLGSYEISFIDQSAQHNHEFIEFDHVMNQRVVNIFDLLSTTRRECIRAGISNSETNRIQQQILNMLQELSIPIWFPEATKAIDTLDILPIAILTDSFVNKRGIVSCKLKFIKKEQQQAFYQYLATKMNNIELKQVSNANNNNVYNENQLFYNSEYRLIQGEFIQPKLIFLSDNQQFEFSVDLNLFEKLSDIASIKKKYITNRVQCTLCNVNTPIHEILILIEHGNQPICLHCFENENKALTTNNHAGVVAGNIIGAGASEPQPTSTEPSDNIQSVGSFTSHELDVKKCTLCKKSKNDVFSNEQEKQVICIDCIVERKLEFVYDGDHGNLDIVDNRGNIVVKVSTSHVDNEPQPTNIEPSNNRQSVGRFTNRELAIKICELCNKITPEDETIILKDYGNQLVCLGCVQKHNIKLSNDSPATIVAKTSKDQEKPKCPICLEYIISNQDVPPNCGHLFHKKCLDKWGNSGRGLRTCPVCRK